MRAYPKALTGLFAVLLAGVTGCGASGTDSNGPTGTAGTSGAEIEFDNTINYGSFGTTAKIDCAQGKSLAIGGSNNTLTVTGTCANVNIGGADNKITLQKIDHGLSVVGLANTITYRDGDPTVHNTGSGNTIKKG